MTGDKEMDPEIQKIVDKKISEAQKQGIPQAGTPSEKNHQKDVSQQFDQFVQSLRDNFSMAQGRAMALEKDAFDMMLQNFVAVVKNVDAELGMWKAKYQELYEANLASHGGKPPEPKIRITTKK